MSSPDIVQLSIGTVQFGQVIRDEQGVEQLAAADMVILSTIIGDDVVHSVQMEPEAAMKVATGLAQAAGQLMSNRLDNNGKKVGLLGYIKTMATKTPPTPPAPAAPRYAYFYAAGNDQSFLPANREHLTDTPTGAIYRWPETRGALPPAIAVKMLATRDEAEYEAERDTNHTFYNASAGNKHNHTEHRILQPGSSCLACEAYHSRMGVKR